MCYIYIIQPILKHESIDIIKVIGSFIKGHYHLWFIYLIVGLYLILPLLRLWVKDENKKYVKYFIILSIIFTYIIPQIINIGSKYSNLFFYLNDIMETQLQLKYIGGFTTYFILGWYIHNYDIKNKKKIYILGGVGLITSIMGTYIFSVSTGKIIQMYGNLSLNVLLHSMACFVFIKSKFINMKDKDNKFINSISKYSLGIYAIHALNISILYLILEKIGFEIAIINIPLVFIISFVVTYFCSFICSKIPILRKIV